MKMRAIVGVVAAGFSLLLIGCDPDFSKPGVDGALPPNTVISRAEEFSGYPPVPDPPVCGDVYSIAFTVRQNVAICQGFDFTEMYQRLQDNVQDRTDRIDCPQGCRPLHTWVITRKWDCDALLGTRVAYVSTKIGFLCPKPGDALPAGLGVLPAGVLLAPYEEGDSEDLTHFQRADELIFEEVGDFVDVPCPGYEVAVYDYRADVPGCENLNFEPYVQTAEQGARDYFDSLKCADGCEKQTFKILRRQWDCDASANDVMVAVHFEVHCKRAE